jgi:hypothetical protein
MTNKNVAYKYITSYYLTNQSKKKFWEPLDFVNWMIADVDAMNYDLFWHSKKGRCLYKKIDPTFIEYPVLKYKI